MVVQQYIHQLNNSELGRTGVHESYVSVPRGIVPSLNFVTEGAIQATFKRSGNSYRLKFKKYPNGEFRLTGLGELYRTSGVSAGDLIVIEDLGGVFWIDFVYRKNLIVFGSQGSNQFECRNEDRLKGFVDCDLPCYKDGQLATLLIRSKGAIKPRSDSPREVNVFEISVDGNVIAGSRNQAINLFTVNGFHFLVPSSPDSIRKLQWSDHE